MILIIGKDLGRGDGSWDKSLVTMKCLFRELQGMGDGGMVGGSPRMSQCVAEATEDPQIIHVRTN